MSESEERLRDLERIAWGLSRYGFRAYPYITPCLPSDFSEAHLHWVLPRETVDQFAAKTDWCKVGYRGTWALDETSRAILDAGILKAGGIWNG